MKITLEITKYRAVVTSAYMAGFSRGYNAGKIDGIKDTLKKNISDIPFESDYPFIDDALYLCELDNKEYVICKFKNSRFTTSDSKTTVKIEDIAKWKRI